jgi:hypothetical protein
MRTLKFRQWRIGRSLLVGATIRRRHGAGRFRLMLAALSEQIKPFYFVAGLLSVAICSIKNSTFYLSL